MLKLTYEPSVIYAVILLLNTVTDVNIWDIWLCPALFSSSCFLCPSFEELERKFNKNEQKQKAAAAGWIGGSGEKRYRRQRIYPIKSHALQQLSVGTVNNWQKPEIRLQFIFSITLCVIHILFHYNPNCYSITNQQLRYLIVMKLMTNFRVKY